MESQEIDWNGLLFASSCVLANKDKSRRNLFSVVSRIDRYFRFRVMPGVAKSVAGPEKGVVFHRSGKSFECDVSLSLSRLRKCNTAPDSSFFSSESVTDVTVSKVSNGKSGRICPLARSEWPDRESLSSA